MFENALIHGRAQSMRQEVRYILLLTAFLFGFWVSAMLALQIFSPQPAGAQAGMEAAGQYKHAADWAERQQGSSRFRYYTSSSVTTTQGGSTSSGYAAPAKKRPRSGAPGSIAGRVVGLDGKTPVAGMRVTLNSTEIEYELETYNATTDESGIYRFKKVEPGIWAVGLDPLTLSDTYAPPRPHIIRVSKSQQAMSAPIQLVTGGCISGQAVWSDGFEFTDPALEVTVAPMDTNFYAVGANMDAKGNFQFCAAPADSAMIWVDCGDGRWIGRTARLTAGEDTRVDLSAEPGNAVPMARVGIQVSTRAEKGVGYAELLVVGRRPEKGGQAAMIFQREEITDRQGYVELFLPLGVYDFLAMNPREGEIGRMQGLEVIPHVADRLEHEIVVVGSSTEEERYQLYASMIDRAELFMYLWAY